MKHILTENTIFEHLILQRNQIVKYINYNKIIKYYFDKDTIPGRSFISDEQWADTGMCSDVESEQVTCAAVTSHKEQQKKKEEENRLIWSEGISLPIPRSERSVQVKIAQLIHAASAIHAANKNLDKKRAKNRISSLR